MWPRKADRFIDQFVLGAIVCAGTWYLHRPFLLVYFPSIAPDRGASNIGNHLDVDLALVLFAVAAICVGALIIHASGFASFVVFESGNGKTSGLRGRRQSLHRLGRFLTWWTWPDPRVRSIQRYLRSPRSTQFCAMMSDWSFSTPSELGKPAEALIAHQHVVARLRALSPATRQAVEELHSPVTFGGGLFVALCILVIAAALSFATASMVENVRLVQPNAVKWTILLVLYTLTVVSAFSFQHRYQDFAEQVLTAALHFHQSRQPSRSAPADFAPALEQGTAVETEIQTALVAGVAGGAER